MFMHVHLRIISQYPFAVCVCIEGGKVCVCVCACMRVKCMFPTEPY